MERFGSSIISGNRLNDLLALKWQPALLGASLIEGRRIQGSGAVLFSESPCDGIWENKSCEYRTDENCFKFPPCDISVVMI